MTDFEDLELQDEQGRFTLPKPHLCDVARQILQLYTQLRPQYTGGQVRVGKKQLIHFYRAAELCCKMKLTPTSYVKQQLEGMARMGTFWPNGIAAVRHLEAVPDYQLSDKQATKNYKSQLTLFLVRAKIYGARFVLEDPSNQFTPLFRCAIAQDYGFHDIVKEYEDAARLELESVPVARKTFGKLLGFIDGDL